ncbi:hypothetical protein Taro_035418, partial [Colocasia esculenta]|nr:hypothetical protein [Colocasia esculenta]
MPPTGCVPKPKAKVDVPCIPQTLPLVSMTWWRTGSKTTAISGLKPSRVGRSNGTCKPTLEIEFNGIDSPKGTWRSKPQFEIQELERRLPRWDNDEHIKMGYIASATSLDLADIWAICRFFGICKPVWDGAPSPSKTETH